MAEHNNLGKRGEKIALDYLQKKGYKILHTNWRSRRLELDIVAQYKEELVVVEVKTRRNNFFEEPEDAIDNKKIKHIVQATDSYIKYYGLELDVRFDVLSILLEDHQVQVEHIEDAFISPVF